MVTMAEPNKLRLGALIYDLEAIASHYKVDVKAKCWPTLLSRKKGGHALVFCPAWGKDGHTSLTSEAHTKPQGWSLDHVEKNFTTKAPAKESSQAGVKRKA